jgi:hypothetical protein
VIEIENDHADRLVDLPESLKIFGKRLIKVAAIDEDWSGLKFVYRLKDRH